MLRIWLLVCVLWAQLAAADEIGLALPGDTWKWWIGPGEPSAPPEAWRQPEFNDLAWGTGRAGFSWYRTGYAATALPENVVETSTVHLRRQFVVEDVSAVQWLVLRIDYDDGFVAFLNGVEVARRGMPGEANTFVPYNTLASRRASGNAELVDLTRWTGALRQGTNVLALQWHSAYSWASARLLLPELLANFTRGPFLQNTSTDRQVIVWQTPVPSDTVVDFGPTPALGIRQANPSPVTTHVAVLTNLIADTAYYYRVSSSDGLRWATSAPRVFRTFKAEGSFRFVVAADVGLGTMGQLGVADGMRAARPDLVLIAGDLVYPSYYEGRADFNFFSVYHEQMRETPFFPVVGNHETVIGYEPSYLDDFILPTNSVPLEVHQTRQTGPESYYSFDHGDAHFVGLYVPLLSGRYGLTNGDPQVVWLESDLAASVKPWKILFLHHPVADSGAHRSDDYNFDGVPDPTDLANLLLPIARRHGVQLVLSGHNHAYERFNPMSGVAAIVTGGGGAYLYSLVQLDPASAQYWRRYEFVTVDLTRDSMQVRATDDKGVVFDSMFFQRALPPPRVYDAAWNTPMGGPLGGDDGDGNRTGQTFDFVGDPIPTMPGEFSNLGRMFVNYDHSQLYLGLEQPMIYGDNNIFLFIQSPRLLGVSGMAGLGNGVVDPLGQGVDGLDFLENLGFTNFTPTVACILGDEYADGQFRSFTRVNQTLTYVGGVLTYTVQTNLALNIGQGVFRLDAGFSDVPGAKVWQFNRSPQSGPIPGEQNANFIEVAIPLAELGLAPGDRLKIGGVVGGALFSTDPMAQTRLLDRSFLGVSLAGAGQGPFLLEGVEVQLGPDLDSDGDGLTSAQEASLGTDPTNPDTDSDGLPDGWEVGIGFNPLSAVGRDGGGGDPDGDGFTNRQEYLAGTEPLDRASALRMTAARQAGRLRIVWTAVPGRSYLLEYANSVEGTFTPLPGVGFPRLAVSASELADLDEPSASSSGYRFYRMRVVP